MSTIATSYKVGLGYLMLTIVLLLISPSFISMAPDGFTEWLAKNDIRLWMIDFFIFIICSLMGVIHYNLVMQTIELEKFGNLMMPYAIIDRGEEGEAFELPGMFDDHYEALPSSKIYDRVKEVKALLNASRNPFYFGIPDEDDRLQVLIFPFRFLDRVNDTAEEHKAWVIREMKEARKSQMNLLSFLQSQKKITDGYIQRVFIAGGRNGSI